MFILSYISNGFEFWLVNYASLYENSELRLFKNINVLGEISSNLPNHLLGTKVCHTLESCR